MNYHNTLDDPFKQAVVADVRGQLHDDPEKRAWIRSFENLDRWHDELLSLLRSVDFQLSSHKADRVIKRNECLRSNNQQGWMEFEERTAKWRTGAIRFKRQIEEHLTEAKSLRRQLHNIPAREIIEERDHLLEVIRVHRDRVNNDYDDEISADPDQELWRVLSQ